MKITELLENALSGKLIDITISAKKKKSDSIPDKIKIRPVMIKEKYEFQVQEYIGKKVFHKNLSKDEAEKYILENIENNFKQAQLQLTDADAHILCGRDKKMNIKYKKCNECRVLKELSHNRTKNYILKEGQPVDFLIDLGVMTKEGKIVNSKYDKYRQINRFLEFVEDILPALDKDREQTIIDFGCGKSYLTFAMYYYLKVLKGYDVRIIGLDLKEDVISKCNSLRKKYGFDKLDFYVGDIASYDKAAKVDMVVTLHACDTATDYALEKAVKWGAKVILSVPCCQHEANKTIDNELLKPVLKYGILKERFAAIMTDAIRANLLESKGYDTQILEFIDMEHTPKNLLIRAVKSNKNTDMAQIDNLQREFNLSLTLGRIL